MADINEEILIHDIQMTTHTDYPAYPIDQTVAVEGIIPTIVISHDIVDELKDNTDEIHDGHIPADSQQPSA